MIEAEQRSEQALQQAQKMEAIGRLSTGVAHDFNNMLAAIRGFSELLLKPTSEIGQSERRQIEQIRMASERATSLTRQLLAFGSQQILRPRVVDLGGVVSETKGVLQCSVGEEIELVIGLESKPLRLYADPDQLAQVLLDLAVNARDAMPDGGRLTIETGTLELAEPLTTPQLTVEPGSYVLLSVTDTGIGIDAETSARLFEPFFTTKERRKGLGLSTVYGVVRQSAGYVWVESEPGRGASFKVALPQSDAPLSEGSEHELPALGSGSGTVLLVEDEAITRDAIAELLLSAGYRVLVAHDGKEAFDLVLDRGEEISVVMTDIVMPRMGGTELAEALAQRRLEVPVLFTSGYVVGGLVRQGILAEASFIQKPFSLDALQRKLNEVMATAAR